MIDDFSNAKNTFIRHRDNLIKKKRRFKEREREKTRSKKKKAVVSRSLIKHEHIRKY